MPSAAAPFAPLPLTTPVGRERLPARVLLVMHAAFALLIGWFLFSRLAGRRHDPLLAMHGFSVTAGYTAVFAVGGLATWSIIVRINLASSDFRNHAAHSQATSMLRLVAVSLAILLSTAATAWAADPPPAGRIIFLGDSITYGGHYIDYIDALLRLENPQAHRDLLDLGLPSETVSGLSEPDHADGKFPRPALARAARSGVGENKARFGRGLLRHERRHLLSAERRAVGEISSRYSNRYASARLRPAPKSCIVTPPVFDPLPIRGKTLPAGLAEYRQPYEGYDDVLQGYTAWLLAQRADGWDVVDAHGPMKERLAEMRRTDPSFRFAGDGVHINTAGHWIIAREILLPLERIGQEPPTPPAATRRWRNILTGPRCSSWWPSGSDRSKTPG